MKRSIHGNLKTQRLCAGLSLRQAGMLVGRSAAMLSRSERGQRRLNPDARARLLEIYRIKNGGEQ